MRSLIWPITPTRTLVLSPLMGLMSQEREGYADFCLVRIDS